ncbi:MAG: Fic family protein [bacterium]|nr:Fic family protein [bacterium]
MSTDTIDIAGTMYCYRQPQKKFIEELAGRVKDLRKGGSLTPEILGKISKHFKIKNIYNSNAIEGNKLDFGETEMVVQQGMTISGKSLKDQAEAKNLSEAIDYLQQLASDAATMISTFDIKQIHQLVLKDSDPGNAGKYRTGEVRISGSKFTPPGPEAVPADMDEFNQWLTSLDYSNKNIGHIDGLLNAAAAHTWLVYIHPFVDGNGRVARLLMNLLLMKYGYPIGIIAREERMRYYDALEESHSSDLSPFISLVSESVQESLEEYEQAVRESRDMNKWSRELKKRAEQKEHRETENEFQVWKSAVDLLKSSFKQAADMVRNATPLKVYYKDFGTPGLDKYCKLKTGRPVKQTWLFRIDFKEESQPAGSDESKAVRLLFFAGNASPRMKAKGIDVSIQVSREDPPNSYSYLNVDDFVDDNRSFSLPAEIGYLASNEEYLVKRMRMSEIKAAKLKDIVKSFFDEVLAKDFGI